MGESFSVLSEKESSEEKREREIKGRHKGGVNRMDKNMLTQNAVAIKVGSFLF